MPAFAPARIAAVAALALLAAGCGQKEAVQDKGETAARRRTPSGLPVPRYVSLKFGEVNARRGPGEDYPIQWTYRARGMPLQVIAETSDWRRVCDPEGAVAWVHQRAVDTRRTVMRTAAEPLDMRRKAAADSPVAARLAGRSVAGLDRCEAGWCLLKAGDAEGWAPEGEVWGTAEAPRCQPPLPVVSR